MRKKIVFLPYDMDTAIGINNEGTLSYGYGLEDTDHVNNADVFNGQQSVLWNNLRDTFGPEIVSMYRQLRSEGKISYENVEKMFEEHQAKWPESIFNEDAKYKYIDPLQDDDDDSYLYMALGSKEEQRKWWLFNRFRYMDSKFNAGDALTDVITLRAYAKGNITVTPYADIYPSIKYGSYLVQTRGERNQEYEMVCPNQLDTLNDTEVYIYSASALSSIGDISALKVGYADFSNADKLQEIKIGDSSSSYDNPNVYGLSFGNNTLLRVVDARNCSGLGLEHQRGTQKNVNLGGCTGLEEAYFEGTNVGSVTLPNGGVLKKLHLPGTIANLTIRNQTGLTDFVCPDYSNITTLWLENPSDVIDTLQILDDMPEGGRVRLFNFHWEVDDLADIMNMADKLDTMRGIDQNGNNVDTAQVFGTIHAQTATNTQIGLIRDRYPGITITYDTRLVAITYKSMDGSETLQLEILQVGGNGSKLLPDAKAQTAQYTYTPSGWSSTVGGSAEENILSNVMVDKIVYAVYAIVLRQYAITFIRGEDDGDDVLKTIQANYGEIPAYGTPPVSSRGTVYAFQGWDPELTEVTGPATYEAIFKAPVTVSYYDWDGTWLHDESVAYNRHAVWDETPVRESTVQYVYTFSGWSTTQGGAADANARRYVKEDTDLYAVYTPTLQRYTITFVKASADGGGTLQTGTVPYGSMPVYSGSTPTTTKTDSEYEFSGWSPTIVAAVGNQTYTAVFRDIADDVVKYLNGHMTVYESNTITTIGTDAFYQYDGFTTARISANYVGKYAFQRCHDLELIEFTNPTDVITIDSYVFDGCSSFTIIIRSSEVAILTSSSAISSTSIDVYVPDNLVDTYKTASNWSTLANTIYPISDLDE